MDGFQLFKKLGIGAKFDFKRFQNDAERLKIIAPVRSHDNKTKLAESTKDVDITASESSSSKKRKSSKPIYENGKTKTCKEEEISSVDDKSDEDNRSTDNDTEVENKQTELYLLGNITSSGDITPKKTKALKKKTKKKRVTKLADLKQEEINHLRNVNKIHTYGSDIPNPVHSFCQLQTEYGLHPTLMENIRSVGYTVPTSIQMQAIPVMLHRRDLMACAPTGSGKTAAFILPILHHLKQPHSLGFRALVLAPTRELAKQTTREFKRLAEGLGFRIHFIEKVSTAIKKFGPKAKKKFDVLVTTPNRLVYLLKHNPPIISLSSVEWLVVDESDKLFEEGTTGFRDQLAEIYKACDSGNIRRAMFSATFAFDVEEWCKLNLDNVIQVYVGPRNSATENVEQELLFVGTESGKLLAVRNLINIANVMKEAGCPVPDYMLQMKPPNKKMKKLLSRSNRPRDRISTVPLPDLQKQNWKKKLIKDVKRKRKLSHGEGKAKTSQSANKKFKTSSITRQNDGKPDRQQTALIKMKHTETHKNKVSKL
ncbi:probable ATP-dependent RNA helicase DDX52 [Gigantopelta aegis]|uniref:probable ATP-dependent RNA helicase DDX52 n=1 Tax=Gigantopelta aegis TaxID=1735272 RepID=UPI001B88B897|nr:probable ATP-dependent RNA helicase DDX52 [Gigantopelta aegis]